MTFGTLIVLTSSSCHKKRFSKGSFPLIHGQEQKDEAEELDFFPGYTQIPMNQFLNSRHVPVMAQRKRPVMPDPAIISSWVGSFPGSYTTSSLLESLRITRVGSTSYIFVACFLLDNVKVHDIDISICHFALLSVRKFCERGREQGSAVNRPRQCG